MGKGCLRRKEHEGGPAELKLFASAAFEAWWLDGLRQRWWAVTRLCHLQQLPQPGLSMCFALRCEGGNSGIPNSGATDRLSDSRKHHHLLSLVQRWRVAPVASRVIAPPKLSPKSCATSPLCLPHLCFSNHASAQLTAERHVELRSALKGKV